MDFWHLQAAASPGPIVYSAAGLAAVIARSISASGDCARVRAAPAGMQAQDMPASPMRQIAGGFLCNAFNPQAPIYFLALFTVVLSHKLPPPTLLVYGAAALGRASGRRHGRARCACPGDCARLSG